MALLSVQNLEVTFRTDDGIVRAVNGLSFSVDAGKTLGIVGESGSGKSVSSLAIMKLIAMPPGRIESGVIDFKGQDLLKFSEPQMRAIRGNKISMIFQDPMTSLNPVLTVGDQIAETIMVHQKKSNREAMAHAVDMLKLVRIPEAADRVNDYPHQFSGGMRQRVMIAMALSCNPSLLLADEPTTALDVTIQAQILRLMRQLSADYGAAVIVITHDLGVVAGMCRRILVMYAGRIVEEGPAKPLFKHPHHPYTVGLLRSVPRLDRPRATTLQSIEGLPPDLSHLPPGCAFAPRCWLASKECWRETPPLFVTEEARKSACFHYDELRTEVRA
jgi:oligopeptide transport system ATP-binding protein